MRPEKVTFHVYADSPEEARALQDALYDLVIDYYQQGTLLTASRLTEAVRQYGSSPIVKNYFR